MKDSQSIERAMSNARQAWKDTGDPVWSYVEGALSWVLETGRTADVITARLESEAYREA